MHDTLAALATSLANWQALSHITWVIGDPGLGAPGRLPWGFIVPTEDQVQERSGQGSYGWDHDRYTIEIVVVDDLNAYGDPRPVPGENYFVSPGYRSLMDVGQEVRAALRADITLSGHVATSAVKSIGYTPIMIDTRFFRACRVVWEATERRAR